MAAALECGSAETRSPQTSPPTWLRQDLRLLCAYIYIDKCVCVCVNWLRAKKGKRDGGAVCRHNPSSLAAPFIALLSQLQTKPQCGASLLKSQHDKNSWIEVAQPTLPWHMGYFLQNLFFSLWTGTVTRLWGCRSHSPNITSCPNTPMIGCRST